VTGCSEGVEATVLKRRACKSRVRGVQNQAPGERKTGPWNFNRGPEIQPQPLLLGRVIWEGTVSVTVIRGTESGIPPDIGASAQACESPEQDSTATAQVSLTIAQAKTVSAQARRLIRPLVRSVLVMVYVANLQVLPTRDFTTISTIDVKLCSAEGKRRLRH
jgi:hypothetical protein